MPSDCSALRFGTRSETTGKVLRHFLSSVTSHDRLYIGESPKYGKETKIMKCNSDDEMSSKSNAESYPAILLELAERKLWKTIFTRQTCYRKILDLGLRSEYTNPYSEVGKFLIHMFGLKYVPPCTVGDGFVELHSIAPNHNQLTRLLDYVFENHLSEDAKFSPKVWASVPTDEIRTTNRTDSFHRHLKRQLYKPHPFIHEFTQLLKQSETYLSFNTVRYKKTVTKIIIVLQLNYEGNINVQNYHYCGTLKKFQFGSSPSYCRQTAYRDDHWTVCFKIPFNYYTLSYKNFKSHCFSSHPICRHGAPNQVRAKTCGILLQKSSGDGSSAISQSEAERCHLNGAVVERFSLYI
ncbi:hypothetical protein ANN_17496 [Periplaneta americana]|uniref:Uncharacterized protein n=1 Tax=Periplaneta americana TaxID=6978 RepID=A0ABQ8SV81_PERAM|nr:hypothetical protein ANN_17496 [Periplaneta americana]